MKRPEWKRIQPPPDITPYGYCVGTSGYFFEDWPGRFNPPGQTASDALRFYQDYFSFSEIRHTFSEVPSAPAFAEIENNSKESMKYAVLVHRDISHTQAWDICTGKAVMDNHIAAVGPLLETGKFYSFLIQLEGDVHRSQKALDYLLCVASGAIEKRIDVHVEFRHASWHNRYCLQAMKDAGVGVCNTEIPPGRHIYPLKAYATTDKGYVRYSGRSNFAQPTARTRSRQNDYLYTDGEIEGRIQGQIQLSRKTGQVAVVYNNFVRAQAVVNAIQNIRQLSQRFEFSAIIDQK